MQSLKNYTIYFIFVLFRVQKLLMRHIFWNLSVISRNNKKVKFKDSYKKNSFIITERERWRERERGREKVRGREREIICGVYEKSGYL